MITVYFESSSHCEVVAEFPNEDIYIVCLPALESYAEKSGYIVTESVNEGIA